MYGALKQPVLVGQRIRVRGVVQGVGYRPFVAKLALAHDVFGEVCNDAAGVLIHAWSEAAKIDAFIAALHDNRPPLAQVQAVEVRPLHQPCESQGFAIVASSSGATRTGIAADAASCPDCLDEVFDAHNRRYRYPFTNCTHCGPRLSIVREIPYDRQYTSMASFAMCAACRAEYESQTDRRFHAQPNACPECGPQLQLLDATGAVVETADPLATASAWIEAGRIVAIKGLGGIHLACDAGHEQTVAALRRRKQRYHKPFALMGCDVQQIRVFVHMSQLEKAQLEDVAAPVVLLQRKPDCGIAASVAPEQASLGFMLPYTPLHHLLMHQLKRPIVLTSGNLSDEPQCIDNDEATMRLQGLADGYLLHNRDIVNRLDDSVLRVVAGGVRMLRRARGYAPGALPLPECFSRIDGVLAMGGELKNTFCMISHGQAIVSQHMGDLEHTAVHRDYRHNLHLYRHLYDFKPATVVVDMHPDYFSTQWGRELAEDEGCRLVEVQHHHAHVTACMAEYGLAADAQVLGITLDGLGMGLHGQLWGGEFLLVSYASFKRLASIQPVAMIGGSMAMREPWRNTYAQLHACGWSEMQQRFSDLAVMRLLAAKPLQNLEQMIGRGLNSPQVSSMGRLFDAVAAALDICAESVAFEGQAAMALETLATGSFEAEQGHGYPVELVDTDGMLRLSWQTMWPALLQDLQQGVERSRVAARFLHSLIDAVVSLAIQLVRRHGLQRVVLSGGVFQNRLLLEGVQQCLSGSGIQVLIAADFPLNDGGLALGQAVIAAARAWPSDE